MTDILTAIEDMAANLLSIKEPSVVGRELIDEAVANAADMMSKINNVSINNDEITLVAKKLQERFDIKMPLGTLLYAEDYRPWLDDVKGNIEWYYWSRYKRLLGQIKLPPQVIRAADNITDQILDHMENPNRDGSWDRRGMVVGHVQSGKTANYIGLICKAADSGYRVIIVLAGMLNSLRNQTQVRMDDGFIGIDSSRILDNAPLIEKLVGVGRLNNERLPVSFTTSKQDFNASTASQISMTLDALNEPLVLVVKKHKGTLNHLIRWLKHNNPHNLQAHPVLIIDDEADHASINTKNDDYEVTAINGKIRELLHLFARSSYVGYTATPFANIFINPETDNEMLGDDLFPRDFIHSLDPPDNYIGPSHIFEDETKLNTVIEVKDNEVFIPIKHRIDLRPTELPPSMKEAVQSFIISKAIRNLRGQYNKHHSMMINVSRFTGVQSYIKLLVDEYLKELQQAISNHSKLDEAAALKNSRIASLKTVWEKVFSSTGHTWKEVQSKLKDAVSPIRVIEVNSSSSAEPLDYSIRNYPHGRNVIAVGGLNLSRGLTLEGLTISYFLRNSIMYDTLMQMGRWFGYRDGFSDLCRVYMTADAASWYGHISGVMEELSEEFRRMKRADMTPKDFGLCVRSHPESLIVTARNKMRTGSPVLRQVDLEGRLVETAVLLKREDIVDMNLSILRDMLAIAKQHGNEVSSTTEPNYLWKDVPAKYILDFVNGFENHPASQLTEKKPVTNYIEWLNEHGKGQWDVVLVKLETKKESKIEQEIIPGYKIIAQKRKVTEFPQHPGNGIALNKRRVASRGLEKAGLNEEEIEEAESRCDSKNIPDRVYREIEGRNPLLMLHLLDCRIDDDIPLFEKGIAAYGVGFPGKATARRPKKLVEYIVNTTWWKNNYVDLIEEAEESEDE